MGLGTGGPVLGHVGTVLDIKINGYLPYFQVDMGKIRLVDHVLIQSGCKDCGYRLQGTELRVGHQDQALGNKNLQESLISKVSQRKTKKDDNAKL